MSIPPPQGGNSGQQPRRDRMQTDKYTQPLTKPTQPQPQRYTPEPPAPPSRLTPEKRRGGVGRSLLFLLLLLLVGVGIYAALGGRFGFLGGSDTAPVAAVANFYSALDAGKCADARTFLANPDMTSQQLCVRWKALKDAGPTTIGAPDTVTVSGDTATANWLRTAGGKPNNRPITLQKINNDWKITSPTSELLPTP